MEEDGEWKLERLLLGYIQRPLFTEKNRVQNWFDGDDNVIYLLQTYRKFKIIHFMWAACSNLLD